MTQTPRQVIKETISQASTVFVAQTEGGYGVILSPGDLKKLIEDLDTATSREEQLKKAAEKVSEIYESDYTDEEAVNAINDMFLDLLRTLYPDTPAPTNEEVLIMGPGREPAVCENDELVSEFEIACRAGDYEFAEEYKKEILRRLESNSAAPAPKEGSHE